MTTAKPTTTKKPTITFYRNENGTLKKELSETKVKAQQLTRQVATLGENLDSLSAANERLRNENAELQKLNAKPKAIDKMPLEQLLSTAVTKLRKTQFIRCGVNSRHILSLVNSAHSMAAKAARD